MTEYLADQIKKQIQLEFDRGQIRRSAVLFLGSVGKLFVQRINDFQHVLIARIEQCEFFFAGRGVLFLPAQGQYPFTDQTWTIIVWHSGFAVSARRSERSTQPALSALFIRIARLLTAL